MTGRPGLQTRPGNVHKHPGKVVTDLVRKRRSPAEVAAEKAAIALKRAQEEERRAALVGQVEEIERRLRSLVLDEMVRMKVKIDTRALNLNCLLFSRPLLLDHGRRFQLLSQTLL